MEPRERPEEEGIDVRAALGVAFEVYRRYFGKLMLLALILVVPMVIAERQQMDSPVFGLILLPIGLVTGTWFWASSMMTVKPVRGGGKKSLSDLIGDVWPLLFPLILLMIATEVPTVIGFLLLIVPGVVLSLMWLVAVPVMMFEGKRVLDSMSRSSRLTHGHRMNLLWIALIRWLPLLVMGGLQLLVFEGDSLVGLVFNTAVSVLLNPYQAILEGVTYYGLIAIKEPGGSGAEVDQLEADVGTFDDRVSHRLEG